MKTVGNYVVKTTQGQYWIGDKWACCQFCAVRMTRKEAHKLAHVSGEKRVVRIVRRAR
jgi:hypothetical protein